MKFDIEEKIEFPENIEVLVNGNEITVKGNGLENKRKFNAKNISFKKSDAGLILISKNTTKRERKMVMTIIAHVKNMIEGILNKFVYKLEVVYVHFPVTIDVDKSKNQVIIKNFLGEKKPRIAQIVKGAEVNVNKSSITVESYDKEIAGQTAANLETATKIRNRDRRKFQDGIFITEKCGVPI